MTPEMRFNFFMLDVLCGNKNVEKILIFLFVNGKCYGTQLHRALKSPLTPIQNALNRLETGKLVIGYHEGKTKIYRFNPAYPLLKELEELLKKAYTLLPASEKKAYYVVRDDFVGTSSNQENKARILLAFWDKLLNVKKLTFHAKTNSIDEDGWNGKGLGVVTSARNGYNELIFNEKGTWRGKEGIDLTFSNVFRWTLDRNANMISLEHLRYGHEHPVFLFHLTPSGKNALSSVDSHLCGGDTYFGQIYFDHHSLRLNWRVIGPKKNEELDYYYS